MPFRDYKMSSKGHLRTLVQTQFKIATRVFEDERVDFSPTTTRIQKLQGKKSPFCDLYLMDTTHF